MQTEIHEIEVNGIKYILKDAAQPKLNGEKAVIVRCQSAGVFFGYLAKSELDKGTVTLNLARRLWYWSGAASLSQLAVEGTSKPKDCKFPVAVPEIQLAGVIEIIPVTDKCVESINSVAIWKA